jgi:hypothetical protein
MEHDLSELLDRARRITGDEQHVLRLVLLRLSQNRPEDARARATAAEILRDPRRRLE